MTEKTVPTDHDGQTSLVNGTKFKGKEEEPLVVRVTLSCESCMRCKGVKVVIFCWFVWNVEAKVEEFTYFGGGAKVVP